MAKRLGGNGLTEVTDSAASGFTDVIVYMVDCEILVSYFLE